MGTVKITIESTDKIAKLNGIDCRIWEGHTAAGVPMHCYIARVAVSKAEDVGAFNLELQETRPPSREIEAIPARLVL